MACSGPCLPWCARCRPATKLLAKITMVHAMACVLYLLRTRKIGTPFKDTLTAEQLEIKKKSAEQRAYIFKSSVVFSICTIIAIGHAQKRKWM